MKPLGHLFLLILSGVIAPYCSTDLSNIDRTIVREPKYSSQPFYVLLAIGVNAEKRVWIVVDGDHLYVDRNSNGDLTERSEHVSLDVEVGKKHIFPPGGPVKEWKVFNIGEVAGMQLRLHFWVRNEDFVQEDGTEYVKKYRDMRRKNGWENASLYRVVKDNVWAQIPVILCQSPKDAQVCHISGPLTILPKWGSRQKLKAGDSAECTFETNIGTYCLPPRNYSEQMLAPITTEEVPVDVHPVVHFKFPHKTPGKQPIELKISLNQRCCGDTFFGHVRIPSEAGTGSVKATLSFEAWIQGKVMPSTIEIPIEKSN
jgi:hypothetical protein